MAGLLISGLAQAREDEETFPVREIERPPVLPPGFTRADLFASVSYEGAALLRLAGGAGYGLLPGFELGGLFDLSIAPETTLGNPSLYGLYQLAVLPRATLVPLLRLYLPVKSPVAVQLGAELEVRLSDPAELSLTAAYLHAFGDAPRSELALPLALKLQLARRVFVVPAVGVSLAREGERSDSKSLLWFETVRALAGLEAGVTLGGPPGWMADLAILGELPSLLVFNETPRRLGLRDWSVTLALRLFRYP